MTSGVDEKQSTVDACVLDVAIALRREFLAEICTVLILQCVSSVCTRSNKAHYLDVFDDRVPTSENQMKETRMKDLRPYQFSLLT